MTKKIVFLLVVMVMILSLVVAGCAPKAEPAPGPAPTGAPTAAPTAAPTPAPGEEVHEWTYASMGTAGSLTVPRYQELLDSIELMSGGRLKITGYLSGELVPPSTHDIAEGIQSGILDLGNIDPVGERGVIPQAGLFGGYPGGPDPETLDMWFYMGGGADLMDKTWKASGYDYKLLPKYSWNTPGEVFSASTVKLENSADGMKGLKMRCKGDAGEIFQSLGVSTVFISASEIYQALDRGVIDMAECCSAYQNWEFSFHEVCPYAYFSLTRAPVQGYQFGANIDSWNALSPDLQEILETRLDAWAKRQYQWMREMDLEAFHNMLDYGVVCMDLPPEIDKAILEASAVFYAEQRANDPLFDEIFTSQEQFRKVYETLVTLDSPNAFLS